MSTYRVATGHNVALVSLTVLSPQPDPGEGIQYASVVRVADGTLVRQGPYIDFTWTMLEEASFTTITTLFGVDSAATSADAVNVTVYVRDVNYSNWVRMNGKAQRPFPGIGVNWNVRPNDIVIRVTDLATAS